MAKALKDLKRELLRNRGVRAADHDLAPEYAIARAVIKVRPAAGFTQAELAERMGSTQPYVARLESGRVLPTMRPFLRVAKATGTRPTFGFEAVGE